MFQKRLPMVLLSSLQIARGVGVKEGAKVFALRECDYEEVTNWLRPCADACARPPEAGDPLTRTPPAGETNQVERRQRTNSTRRTWSDSNTCFSCNVCGKTFLHHRSVTLHMSCHEGKTVCPICQKVFSRKYNMKLHMEALHFGAARGTT